MRIISAAVLTAALVAPFAVPASAADLMMMRTTHQPVPSATLPFCENPKVLAQVEDQFEYGAPQMLKSDLAITEFSDLFEKAYFAANEERPIERRYCQGEVQISTGERHTLYYVVEYPMGFASIGWRAEGCVLGLDEWQVYGANCQSLRRF
ncbi:hypothetical protein [Mangrovicella endophytica]|uniref:hypothetical protein n=1 Tax=Mangrovicella endophytica TaxID=2066697 RepID=UPI000C9EB2E9|nr:hypothetical protein [Mangrovicella endophytica]